MKRLMLLFTASAILFSACKRNLAESIQSAEDHAQVETEFSQLYDAVVDVASTNGLTMKTEDYYLPSGALVTFSDSTFNDGNGVAFTVDYGIMGSSVPKGLLCKDGRYRAGKIHVTMSNRWSETPCVITLSVPSANEYHVGNGNNMYKVTGSKVITRTSLTSINVSVANATLQKENGTVTWNSNRTLTLITDAGPGWLNDVYEVSGSATGTNVNGESFTVQTQTPLRKQLSLGCLSTFVSGKLLLTNSNGKVLSIDYDSFGNQACDKTVTVTFNGKTRTISVW